MTLCAPHFRANMLLLTRAETLLLLKPFGVLEPSTSQGNEALPIFLGCQFS